MNTLLERASEYARRGLPVLPCDTFTKSPLIEADVDASGQKIARTGGLYKATRDADLIAAWWKKWPNAMVGVRMGEISGLWLLDLDKPDPDDPKDAGKPDGLASWAKLKAEHGTCPHTHTHITPRGGKHLLFRWRPDRPVTTSRGRLNGTGIDVRGNGGYAIFPPSQRADGKAYEVEDPFDYFNIAEAPDWLYGLIKPEPSISQRATAAIKRPATIKSACRGIEGIIRTIATAAPGERNSILFWGANRLKELADQAIISHSDAMGLAIEAASRTGLSNMEASRTVASAFRGR